MFENPPMENCSETEFNASMSNIKKKKKKDFPVAQMVKNLPAMQEIKVRSLGQEDPLDKGMATHSSTLAWRTL